MKPTRQIISRIPHAGMSGTQWGVVIQRELLEIWIRSMSPRELKKFAAVWPLADQVPPELYPRLDRIIIQQARTVGWRVELSELVRFRKSEWDSQGNGPALHEEYGAACAESALILQKKKPAPLEDPAHWEVKQETVSELRLLLPKLRGTFTIMKKRPTVHDVLENFSKILSDSPATYRHLKANEERWLKFLEQNRQICRPILEGNRLRASTLYDEMLAWSTGRKADSIRQIISRLRPKS